MKNLLRLPQRIHRAFFAACVFLATYPPLAFAQIALPTTGDGYLDKAIAYVQKYVNFSTGALAMGFATVGVVTTAILWFLAPKDGFLGTAMRAVALCIFILNVPLIVMSLKF